MSLSNEVPSQPERELAGEIATRAMIAGWERAIQDTAAKEGLPVLHIENILTRVHKDMKHRDPNSKIPELEDWEVYRLNRADRAPKMQGQSNRLHKLSPALQEYMRKKHPHLA